MEKSKHIFNKKELKHNRKALRKNLTSAEAALWKLLKNKQLEGRKFRRQHSLGNFIVDFYCPAEKLIIELDGDVHGDPQQIQKDSNRDLYLHKLGFNILRFENRWVFQDPDYILKEILKKFLIRDKTLP